MSEGNTEIKLSYKIDNNGYTIFYNSYESYNLFDEYVQNENDLVNYIKMLNNNITNVEQDEKQLTIHTRIFKKFASEELVIKLNYINLQTKKERQLYDTINELKFSQENLLTRIEYIEKRLRKKYIVIGQFTENKIYINHSWKPWLQINKLILNYSAKVNNIRLVFKDRYYKFEINIELFTKSRPKLIYISEKNMEEKKVYEWKFDELTYSSNNKLFLGTQDRLCYYLSLHDLLDRTFDPQFDHYINQFNNRHITLEDGSILNNDCGLHNNGNDNLLEELIKL